MRSMTFASNVTSRFTTIAIIPKNILWDLLVLFLGKCWFFWFGHNCRFIIYKARVWKGAMMGLRLLKSDVMCPFCIHCHVNDHLNGSILSIRLNTNNFLKPSFTFRHMVIENEFGHHSFCNWKCFNHQGSTTNTHSICSNQNIFWLFN
jgi:hypothetical protein